ncbi:MAG: hypothetical protein A4E65_00289 [Syntrophorhabdus sp. PtaU1.Bin153]|nr:MAG: hypothetical protein A4E65_00289 [Syntrophorhabdus sp. PtaU1.Bin153]
MEQECLKLREVVEGVIGDLYLHQEVHLDEEKKGLKDDHVDVSLIAPGTDRHDAEADGVIGPRDLPGDHPFVSGPRFRKGFLPIGYIVEDVIYLGLLHKLPGPRQEKADIVVALAVRLHHLQLDLEGAVRKVPQVQKDDKDHQARHDDEHVHRLDKPKRYHRCPRGGSRTSL